MSPWVTLVLGLLLGWAGEWAVDWLFWRRRASLEKRLKLTESRLTQAEAALNETLKIRAELEAQLAQARACCLALQTQIAVQETAPLVPDDLTAIRGIGPVIAQRLNHAGIFTYRQLSALTPQRLREIDGSIIPRLSIEEGIIIQAKTLASGAHRTTIPEAAGETSERRDG